MGGGGEYLTHPHTLNNFRMMWHPTVSNWENYNEWENSGCENAVIAANKVWKERLLNAPDTYLAPEIDKDLTAFIDSHK